MKNAIVIPARIGSTRFPSKVLAQICEKPMIQWVYEGALSSKLAHKVIVATDSEEVAQLIKKIGGEAILTPSELPTGTDRVFYAVKDTDFQYIINLQGDEPLIRGEVLDVIFQELQKNDADMVTPYRVSTDIQEVQDPNRVKIVSDENNYALYFSRSVIPYNREKIPNLKYKIHIGIYGFTKGSLQKFTSLPKSHLENVEKLEQLRALEHGMKIKLVEVDYESHPVDVPSDIEIIEKILNCQKGN